MGFNGLVWFLFCWCETAYGVSKRGKSSSVLALKGRCIVMNPDEWTCLLIRVGVMRQQSLWSSVVYNSWRLEPWGKTYLGDMLV